MDLTTMTNDLIKSFIFGFLTSFIALISYFFGFGLKNIISMFRSLTK